MLNDQGLRAILQNARRIAILGASDKASRPVDRVGVYLMAQGYTVYPVHPVRKSIWGLPAYPSLDCLPEPVDVVNLFRAVEHCPGHAREVLALPWRPQVFWMQLGIAPPEACGLLADSGIVIVEDLCIKIEHARLVGSANVNAKAAL